ncbi:MAG TPA: glycosyltransferase family 4 protein [Myxococcaceae bacterium]
MRVAVVNPVGGIGGAERVLLDLLRVARARMPEVRFSVLALGEGPLVERAAALGAEVEVVLMPERLAALGDAPVRGGVGSVVRTVLGTAARGVEAARFSRVLGERVLAHRPDVVHSNGLKVHLLLAPMRGRVPVVWHLHDFIGDRPLMRHALRAAAGSAAVAIGISKAVGEDARRWLPGLRCEVVPNGVDVERFSPGPGDGAALDRLAGMEEAPPGTARVGMVATYARWKGQEVFLQAASQVNARFYVVGGPVYRTSGSQFSLEELRGVAARLGVEGRVGFVPFQERTEAVYRALDVVVHASTRPEPFGLTIAEAMACGRPLIASRKGGAAELFADGVEAVGLPEVSAGALAQAISGLLADPRRRDALGAAARAGAVERHSSERFGAGVLEVYRSVVK